MSYILGLTGTIGSGKSFVASLFSLCNAAVISADTLAREVVLPGTPAFKEIAKEFGPGILSVDGALDRAELARIVFANPERRLALERIIHPAVRARQSQLLETLKQNPLIILDVPLLFETGMNRECDATLVVIVDEKTRRERLLANRGTPAEDVDARAQAQWPQEKKAERADFVIENSGQRAQTARSVLDILQSIFPNGLPPPLQRSPLENSITSPTVS